jgi:hypothetical protein
VGADLVVGDEATVTDNGAEAARSAKARLKAINDALTALRNLYGASSFSPDEARGAVAKVVAAKMKLVGELPDIWSVPFEK